VTAAGLLKRFGALISAKSLRDGLVGAFMLYLAWADVAAFGNFMLAMAAGAIVVKVVGCGLNYLLIRRLGDPQHASLDQVVAVNLLKLVLLCAALAGLWGFNRVMGYEDALSLMVMLVALGMGLGSLVDSLYLVLRMQGRQVSESAIKLGAAALSVALCTTALHFGLGAGLAAGVFALESLLGLAAAIAHLGLGAALPGLVRRVSVRGVAGLAWANAPYALISIVAILYNKSNVFFLERLHGPEAVAAYSASWLLVDWVSCAVSAHLLGGVLFPLMAAWHHRDEARLRALASRTWVWLLALAWPTCLLLTGLRGPLIGIFFPDAYASATELLVVLVWAIPAAFSSNLLLYLMIARGKPWPLLLFMLVTQAVNLALNMALVPGEGAHGAAMVITLSKLLMAALTLAYGLIVLEVLRPRHVITVATLGLLLWGTHAAANLVLPTEAAALLAVLLYGAGLGLSHRRFLESIAGEGGPAEVDSEEVSAA
jgi:O-antigen/teichoic acid export membrane protein